MIDSIWQTLYYILFDKLYPMSEVLKLKLPSKATKERRNVNSSKH